MATVTVDYEAAGFPGVSAVTTSTTATPVKITSALQGVEVGLADINGNYPTFTVGGGMRVSMGSMPQADLSGSITTGGTAQTLQAADTAGWTIEIWNVGAGVLWVNDMGGAAVADQPSIPILANTSRVFSGTAAVSILSATTGHKFTARRY